MFSLFNKEVLGKNNITFLMYCLGNLIFQSTINFSRHYIYTSRYNSIIYITRVKFPGWSIRITRSRMKQKDICFMDKIFLYNLYIKHATEKLIPFSSSAVYRYPW